MCENEKNKNDNDELEEMKNSKTDNVIWKYINRGKSSISSEKKVEGLKKLLYGPLRRNKISYKN